MSKFRKNKSFDEFKIFNYLIAIAIAIMVLSPQFLFDIPYALATTEFTLRTSQQVYVPGEMLEVLGTAEPNDMLAVRLYDPAGLAIRIENIEVDEDGSYRGVVLVWPGPTRNLVFGTYTVEALSSIEGVEPLRTEVSFAGGFDQEIDPSRGHNLGVKLDAPSQITVDTTFRIFVQITFDGALVEAIDDEAVTEILGTSHIHSSNSTIILNNKFKKLHPGIYYADVELGSQDSYIIHATGFYRGFLSHDTRLVAVTNSSIATLQESVDQLNIGLDATNEELGGLQQGLEETRFVLNDTKATITDSTKGITEQIELAQQASGQINSFILPVLALISVIIALQISLFARIRASYR
ncbi:MAG TPA: hypothetical protein VJ742_05725 [Nitrososphaera sp.]|nr:hypothetical protein [Nitrososphaera sp.]